MVVGRDDLVLGKIAFLHRDLATAAGGTAAADTFDVDTKLPCSIQYGGADRKVATLTRGHEKDEGIRAVAGLGH